MRIYDAIDVHSDMFKKTRAGGITTVNIMPGSGHLMSGQTIYLKLREFAMVAMTIVSRVSGNFEKPGTRDKGISMLREAFVAAQDYQRKLSNTDVSKRPDRNLSNEILVRVVEKEVPALITAQSARDIITAIRLRDEFGFDLIIDGGALKVFINGNLVSDEVR